MPLAYFGIYHDSALTTPVETGTPVPSNSLALQDVQLWAGSANAAWKLQAESAPGVDAITLTPTDSASGSGQPYTAVKLATSQAGLDAAVAGAALDIGNTVTGGAGNAFPFWVRVVPTLTVADVFTNLSLQSNAVVESPV